MADEQQQQAPGGGDPGAGGPGAGQPSEEELREKLEEQIKKVRVQDMILESLASILNLSARRIVKQDERDLEQARVGIDAARGLVDLIDPEQRQQVQNALSEIQMLYAREAGGGGEGGEAPPAEGQPGGGQAPPGGDRGSRLWTPPGA